MFLFIAANAKQTEDDRHDIQSPAENTDQKLPPYTEPMSKEQAVLQSDEPKEDVDVLAETGSVDETEGKDIFGSGKQLSHVDAPSEPTDSRTNAEEDTGNIPGSFVLIYLAFLLIKIKVDDN